MTSFTSTAAYYSRYRVPYPKSLITQLQLDAKLSTDSSVLDLATGPGRLALELAPVVREVIAVDTEPEMLVEGKQAAKRSGIENVKWVHSRAEDLSIPSDSVDLVTIGEAFHRLDQELILRLIRQWLRDQGCVALVGCFGILHGENHWQKWIRETLSQWNTETRQSATKPRGKVHDMTQLVNSGFVGVINREFESPWTWTRQSIIGHFYSTSRFSLEALGEKANEFESVIHDALDSETQDRFTQNVSAGYSIGWNRKG